MRKLFPAAMGEVRRSSAILAGALAMALLLPVPGSAHNEFAAEGTRTFTRILEGKSGNKYRLQFTYSPALPTAGQPTDIDISVARLLAVPDPLLGSQMPVSQVPDLSLLSSGGGHVLVAHLPVEPEGSAGSFGIDDYSFPRGGTLVMRLMVHSGTGDEVTTDFPVTVQGDAAGAFRLWVNLAVALLIIGLTGMQLWRVHAAGAPARQMVRPAVIGMICLVVIGFVMDRFVVGAVLDMRKTKPAASPTVSVAVQEDGSYIIPASIQKDLGIVLADAKKLSLEQKITAFGTIEPRPDLTAVVQAPLWGRIEFKGAPLAVGDHVKKGQELAQLILELSAVERGGFMNGNLPVEQKDLDIKGVLQRDSDRKDATQMEYDRLQALAAQDPAYKADVTWAKQLRDEAAADYLEIYKQDRAYSGKGGTMTLRDPRYIPVNSPMDGVITSVDFVPGDLDLEGEYKKLFTIVDPGRVWARADVYQADVWKLKEGQPVSVFPAVSGAKPVTGVIHWIGDTVDPASRTVPVIVDVPNEGQAFALGSFAKMEFEKTREALAVPESAVVDLGTAQWVYVARGAPGTFVPIEVQPGLKEDGWWQILSGIQEGDQVITKGAALLGSLPNTETAEEAPAPAANSYASDLQQAGAQQGDPPAAKP